eukprot:1250720-Rhodomonas_salina.1
MLQRSINTSASTATEAKTSPGIGLSRSEACVAGRVPMGLPSGSTSQLLQFRMGRVNDCNDCSLVLKANCEEDSRGHYCGGRRNLHVVDPDSQLMRA